MKKYGHAKDENRIEVINNLSEVFLENDNENGLKQFDNHDENAILKAVMENQKWLEKILNLSKK